MVVLVWFGLRDKINVKFGLICLFWFGLVGVGSRGVGGVHQAKFVVHNLCYLKTRYIYPTYSCPPGVYKFLIYFFL